MKIKIAFLIRDLKSRGAQRQLVNLAKYLKQRGFDVSVLVFYPDGVLEEELISNNIRLIHLNKKGRWDIFLFFWRLARTLDQIKPDILHTYITNLLTVFLSPFLPSTKMIWGIRDSGSPPESTDWLVRLLGWSESYFSHRADLIIFNSYAGLKTYSSFGYAVDRAIVIPNGIDIEQFKPNSELRANVRSEWGIPNGTILIGLVARIVPMKDHSTFIKAASKLCKERENVMLVCVGRGNDSYLQELYHLSAQLGISARIVWAGERTDMPAVHNALDILVSSSYVTEGFSNSIAEAMACGVPCIATDVGDSRKILSGQGIIIPPRDSEKLAAAMKTLIARVEEKDNYPKEISQHIAKNFSIKESFLKTEASLLDLLL